VDVHDLRRRLPITRVIPTILAVRETSSILTLSKPSTSSVAVTRRTPLQVWNGTSQDSGVLSRNVVDPPSTIRYANSAQLAYYMNAHNFSVYLIKTCIYRRLNSLVFAGGRSRILLCPLFPHCDKLSVKPNNTQFCRVRSYTRALRCMAALH